MTLPAEELKEIFATIKTVGEMKDGAAVRGINMEGPFLDAKKKGAHVEGYIRKPDAGFFRELNEYSGNMVKLVTLAPNVMVLWNSLMRYIMRCAFPLVIQQLITIQQRRP